MKHKKMNQLNLYFTIGVGGMVGAMSRYGLTILFNETTLYATLSVNLIGCFFLTFLLHHSRIVEKITPEIKTAITVGVIGSFTTFSTIIIESVEHWNTNIIGAMSYLLITIFGGLLFCYFGFLLARRRPLK